MSRLLVVCALFMLSQPLLAEDRVFADGFGEEDNCAEPLPFNCDPPLVDTSGVHLNDIRVDAIERGIEDDASTVPPLVWVELYNGGAAAADLNGMELRTAVESVSAVLPGVSLPPGAFLTVHFLPAGTTGPGLGLMDDLDFSDGQGAIFADFGGEPNPDADDLALVDGTSTLSFVAWGEPLDPVSALEVAAVDAGVWTAGSRIPRSRFTAGESVGLLLDGFHATLGATQRAAGGLRSHADWSTVPWVDQTAGIQQPTKPLQVSPLDGQLLPAAPVELSWRACPQASSYLVELRDSEDGSGERIQHLVQSTSLTLTSEQLPFNPVFWTVSCLFEGNSKRTRFPPPHVFGIAPLAGPGIPPAVSLAVPHFYQRKDTNALCLYDFSEKGGNRIGCPETITGQSCTWDAPHAVSSAAQVRACGRLTENNCVRASIQMVHSFLTGGSPALHQDYISYLIFSGLNPPGVADAEDPEGDLGAGRGVPAGPTRAALAEVLGVDAAEIDVFGDPSFSDIRGWLDAGRPVIMFRFWHRSEGGGHATVIRGYQTTPFGAVIVHDPTFGPDLVFRYSDYTRRNLRSNNAVVAIVPPAIIGTPLGDPPNALHAGSLFDDSGDNDGVVSFDERERFATDLTNFDTDFDQVDDKAEVHSYTFALGERTIVSRNPDIDNDSFRAELDCNSDNDLSGDLDGGEDINGDGGDLVEPDAVGPGETDKFRAGPDLDELNLQVTPTTGPPETTFTLTGGTLSGNYLYQFEVVDCLSPKLPGDPISGGAWATDSSGNGSSPIFTCPKPGCWIVYADLADDNIWQNPNPAVPSLAACDASFTIDCKCVPEDGEDDSRRVDDSSLVLPENNEIDDLFEVEITSFTPDPLDLVVRTRSGTGGVPPIHDWHLIMQVPGPDASTLLDFTNGGFLWAQLQFDQAGALLNPPQWWIWDPLMGWQPEQIPPQPGQPLINDQLLLEPHVEIELVALSLRSVAPIVVVNGQDKQISGVRPVTFGQDLAPTNPGPIADAVPDLQPVNGQPPVGQGFVDGTSCN